jgi:hypothetical protein
MKKRMKGLINAAAATGLVWLLFAPGSAWGQGQTWVGGNLQQMVEGALWRLGALRVNAAFRLAQTGYDSDIYYGFLADRTPDVTSSASTPVQVLLPLSKKAVLEVSDTPEYAFFLDNRSQRAWNNSAQGRIHVALNRIYFQAGGGLSNVRRRLSPELDLNVRQKTDFVNGLVLWQASKSTSLALLYGGSQYRLEDTVVDGTNLADRLDRNEGLLDLVSYIQPSARIRLSLDGQYGSYEFIRSTTSLRNSTSYAFFAGIEFVPGPEDLEMIHGLQGAAAIGYMQIDLRDPAFRDGSGLVGQASVTARLSRRMAVQFNFSRGFQFSIFSGASYYLSTNAGAGITELLSRRASLTYSFSYGRTTYPGSDAGGTGRFYKYVMHNLSLDLQLARYLSVAFQGSFGQRDRGNSVPLRDRFFVGVSLVYGRMGGGMSAPVRGGMR